MKHEKNMPTGYHEYETLAGRRGIAVNSKELALDINSILDPLLSSTWYSWVGYQSYSAISWVNTWGRYLGLASSG